MDLPLIAKTLRMRSLLGRHERWTRADIAGHRTVALQDLRDPAMARSRFHQRFHRGKEGRPLAELPVLTKAELMSSFDELVVDSEVRRVDVARHLAEVRGDERYLDRYWGSRAAGSMGHPGVFLSDRRKVVDHQRIVDTPFVPVRWFDATQPLGEILAGLDEALDDRNRPLLAGTTGAKLVVTVLFSRTQPLNIEGRAEELLQLSKVGGGTVSIHPNVFHRVLELASLRQWQVIQGAERLRVLLTGSEIAEVMTDWDRARARARARQSRSASVAQRRRSGRDGEADRLGKGPARDRTPLRAVPHGLESRMTISIGGRPRGRSAARRMLDRLGWRVASACVSPTATRRAMRIVKLRGRRHCE